MLTLIEGGFFAPTKDAVISLIKDRQKEGRRCFLIVPEQQTLSTERQMADILPPSSVLTFEVTNFTRLADSVFRAVGGIAGEYAEGAEKAITMWRTLSELLPLEEGVGSVSPGTVNKNLSAVLQMQRLGVTAEDLANAAEELKAEGKESGRRLISKLESLASVMSLYRSLLGEYFSDSEQTLIALYERLKSDGQRLLSDCEIFIDGFTSFTEPQKRIVEEMIRICPVTAILTLPPEDRDGCEYLEIRGTREALIRSAGRVNATVTQRKLNASYPASNPIVHEVSRGLWHTGYRADEEIIGSGGEGLRIYEAATPYDECDFIAGDIQRRVMEGERYKDFAIIARDIQAYESILTSSFENAGIPIFLQRRRDVTSFEIIKLIYTAFAVINRGYERRDVIAYSKCSLCGVERELCDELELYCETWQIRGKSFTDKEPWQMNPGGLGAKRDADTHEKLGRIDSTRRALLSPLELLCSSKGEVTVTEHAKGLWSFLEALGVSDALARRAEALRRRGKEDDANDTEKLWQRVISSLDTLVRLVGDTRVNSDTFLNLLKLSFEAESIGRLPSFVDRVITSSADTARITGAKHVYLLGVNYGVFPANVSTDSYFSEKDKEILEAKGLPIKPEGSILLSRELFYFSRALSFGKKTATLLYHLKDSGFNNAAPSEAISAISQLTGGAVEPIKLSSLPKEYLISSPRYALEHIGELAEIQHGVQLALEKCGFGGILSMSMSDIRNDGIRLSRDVAARLYPNTLALTQSRIDKFVSCPLSYLCNYTLGLDKTKRAELDAANIGTFIHLVLERYLSRVAELGNDYAGELPERESFIREVATEFVSESFAGIPEKSARISYCISRLCRVAEPIIRGLTEEFRGSEFRPLFFELPIRLDLDGSPSPAIFKASDGRDVYIYGIIDRVDVYRKGDDIYIRVVDYKTGHKSFSPEDLKRGENLQMFLYLKSIVETKDPAFRRRLGDDGGGRLVPAGVIYVKADVGDGRINTPSPEDALKSVMEKQLRQGMILSEPDSYNAMNSDYLPIKKDARTGKPRVEDSPLAYDLEGWENISGTLDDTVRSIADRMLSGEATALPLKNKKPSPACEWCEFKAICRNARV